MATITEDTGVQVVITKAATYAEDEPIYIERTRRVGYGSKAKTETIRHRVNPVRIYWKFDGETWTPSRSWAVKVTGTRIRQDGTDGANVDLYWGRDDGVLDAYIERAIEATRPTERPVVTW